MKAARTAPDAGSSFVEVKVRSAALEMMDCKNPNLRLWKVTVE